MRLTTLIYISSWLAKEKRPESLSIERYRSRLGIYIDIVVSGLTLIVKYTELKSSYASPGSSSY